MSEQQPGRQRLVRIGGSYTLEERERHAARAAAGLDPLAEEPVPELPELPEPGPLPEIDEDDAAAALVAPEQEDLV